MRKPTQAEMVREHLAQRRAYRDRRGQEAGLFREVGREINERTFGRIGMSRSLPDNPFGGQAEAPTFAGPKLGKGPFE